MKKKIIVSLIIFLAVGGGVWYIGNELNLWGNPSNSGVNNDDNKTVVVSDGQGVTATSTPKEEDTKIISGEKDFGAIASQIISRATVFGSQLSDSDKQRFAAKIEEMKGMIRANYDYSNAWMDLGNYYKLVGDYDGAIKAWDFVSLIRPQNYVSFHNLGDLYGFTLKNYPKAEENFLKSISNEPKNEDAYIQLATIYIYSYKEKAGKTESLLLKGIEANPKSFGLRIFLGNYYKDSGRTSDVLKYFEEALVLTPGNKALQEEINKIKSSQ